MSTSFVRYCASAFLGQRRKVVPRDVVTYNIVDFLCRLCCRIIGVIVLGYRIIFLLRISRVKTSNRTSSPNPFLSSSCTLCMFRLLLLVFAFSFCFLSSHFGIFHRRIFCFIQFHGIHSQRLPTIHQLLYLQGEKKCTDSDSRDCVDSRRCALSKSKSQVL